MRSRSDAVFRCGERLRVEQKLRPANRDGLREVAVAGSHVSLGQRAPTLAAVGGRGALAMRHVVTYWLTTESGDMRI